jgi:hypothetical protein
METIIISKGENGDSFSSVVLYIFKLKYAYVFYVNHGYYG